MAARREQAPGRGPALFEARPSRIASFNAPFSQNLGRVGERPFRIDTIMLQHDKENGRLKRPAPGAHTHSWDPDAMPLISGLTFWEWNIPENSVYFSREWQRILQSQDDDVLGPNTAAWWSRVHEDDVLPFITVARDIAEGRMEQYQTLFRVSLPDGGWVWLFSKGAVVQKHQGMAVLVTGSLMDISALRSDVKFQHGSRDCLPDEAMLAYSPDLIVRMDHELTPLFTNPRIIRSLTRSPGTPIAREGGPLQGIDPRQMNFIKSNVHKVFDTGFAVREQVTLPTVYGHDVTGEYSFWPEFDGRGRVVAVLTQFRDLTDQILAERRAKLNEMRLDALYQLSQMDSDEREQVLDFVMESLIRLTGSDSGFLFFPHGGCGSAGHIVWSKSLHELVGASRLPQQRLPKDLLNLISSDKHSVHRQLTNGSGVYPLLRPLDGDFQITRFISAPALDRGRIVCLAAVFNKETRYEEADLQQLEAFINSAWHIISRHKYINAMHKAKEAAEMANKELQLAKESAEKANKVKDAFLANVSHELRTPLNGVLAMIQLLEPTPLSPRQREYLDTAKKSGHALLRIISDILDISRIEADRFELHWERMDLRSAVSSSIDIFRHEASRKGIAISLEMDEAIPSELCGDDARMRQIVFNLVGNAIKYTERGEISVKCSLLPDSKEDKILVEFSVRDTGIGIPPQMQEKIFEAFTQVDSSVAKKYPGTGLGLSIVKRIMDHTGGVIHLESEVGVGTEVRCRIPFLKAAQSAQPQEKEVEEEDLSAAPVKSMDILVAEDDPTSRFALSTFLKRLGHRPVCVSDGRQALEALLLRPFHCLLTDIQMPDMDGLELVRRIRGKRMEGVEPSEEIRSLLQTAPSLEFQSLVEAASSMPIVSVSAHAMSGDKDRFLAEGMDHYISKPILLKELRSVLNQIASKLDD